MPCTPRGVDAGQVGTDRCRTRRDHELVERLGDVASVVEVAHGDRACVEVDADHLVPQAHVDAVRAGAPRASAR